MPGHKTTNRGLCMRVLIMPPLCFSATVVRWEPGWCSVLGWWWRDCRYRWAARASQTQANNAHVCWRCGRGDPDEAVRNLSPIVKFTEFLLLALTLYVLSLSVIFRRFGHFIVIWILQSLFGNNVFMQNFNWIAFNSHGLLRLIDQFKYGFSRWIT